MSIDLQPVRGTKDLIGEDARRHFHVIGCAVRDGIRDRIHHRGDGRRRAGLTGALDAERVGFGRHRI